MNKKKLKKAVILIHAIIGNNHLQDIEYLDTTIEYFKKIRKLGFIILDTVDFYSPKHFIYKYNYKKQKLANRGEWYYLLEKRKQYILHRGKPCTYKEIKKRQTKSKLKIQKILKKKKQKSYK